MPINGNALLQKLSFQYITCSFSYLKMWAVRQSIVAVLACYLFGRLRQLNPDFNASLDYTVYLRPG